MAPGVRSRSFACAIRSAAAPTSEHREVVRRLATVLAGGASKGRAGEHVLREHLSQLPPGMLTSDFRVNGKVVEFGLRAARRTPAADRFEVDGARRARGARGRHRPDRARPLCAGGREGGASPARARSRSTSTPRSRRPSRSPPFPTRSSPRSSGRTPTRIARASSWCRIRSALPIVLFLYELVRRFGDAADVQASLAEVGGCSRRWRRSSRTGSRGPPR